MQIHKKKKVSLHSAPQFLEVYMVIMYSVAENSKTSWKVDISDGTK